MEQGRLDHFKNWHNTIYVTVIEETMSADSKPASE
jgi:hypothetical protein